MSRKTSRLVLGFVSCLGLFWFAFCLGAGGFVGVLCGCFGMFCGVFGVARVHLVWCFLLGPCLLIRVVCLFNCRRRG